MLELDTALDQILAAVPPPIAEPVPLADAYRRVLLERLSSAMDLPAFDNSSMDGYALRAVAVASASRQGPVRLRLAGRVEAGRTFTGEVGKENCVRVFTGSALPAGADAVVMQEDTLLEAGPPAEVLVLEPVKPWENVRLKGEDVKRGARLAEAGDVLSAGQISLLAATGLARVNAGRRPVVGLIPSGTELREAGQPLGPGQIYESNRTGLSALLRGVGAIPEPFPLVADELEATRLALEQAFNRCDVVVTSGGVSVGEMDFIKSALAQAGGELEFWRVAIRPGKPFVFGRCRGKLLFGLPGNPVSALVTFLVLVRPALLRWQGARDTDLPAHPGVLAEPIANDGARRHFVRVKVDPAGQVYSAGLQASHALSSLAAANGLVDVPPHARWPAGMAVQVLRWE